MSPSLWTNNNGWAKSVSWNFVLFPRAPYRCKIQNAQGRFVIKHYTVMQSQLVKVPDFRIFHVESLLRWLLANWSCFLQIQVQIPVPWTQPCLWIRNWCAWSCLKLGFLSLLFLIWISITKYLFELTIIIHCKLVIADLVAFVV